MLLGHRTTDSRRRSETLKDTGQCLWTLCSAWQFNKGSCWHKQARTEDGKKAGREAGRLGPSACTPLLPARYWQQPSSAEHTCTASFFFDSQLFHVGSWAEGSKWKIYFLDNCPVFLPWGFDNRICIPESVFFSISVIWGTLLRMFFLESLFASQSLLLRKSARPNVLLTPSQPPRTVYAHPLSRTVGQYPIANIIADFCISARWKSPCSLNSTCITLV